MTRMNGSLAVAFVFFLSISKVCAGMIGLETEAVELHSSDALQIAKVVSLLERKYIESGALMIVPYQENNLVVLSGNAANRHRVRALIVGLDKAKNRSKGKVVVIPLKNSEAASVYRILLNTLYSGVSGEHGLSFDLASNSIVINVSSDPEREVRIRTLIEKLDVAPVQVHIEAIIAEINSTKMTELGIQWQFAKGTNSEYSGGTSFAMDGANTAITGNDVTGNPMLAGSGLSVGYYVGSNLLSMLRALELKGESNILATPSITTINNDEAQIIIGNNVPFITGQYAGVSKEAAQIDDRVPQPSPRDSHLLLRQQMGISLMAENNPLRVMP